MQQDERIHYRTRFSAYAVEAAAKRDKAGARGGDGAGRTKRRDKRDAMTDEAAFAHVIEATTRAVRYCLERRYLQQDDADRCGRDLRRDRSQSRPPKTESPWHKRQWSAWEQGSGTLPEAEFVSETTHTRTTVSGEASCAKNEEDAIERWSCRIEERVVVTDPDPDSGLRFFPRVHRIDIGLDRRGSGAFRHGRAATVTITASFFDETDLFGVPQPDPMPQVPDVVAALAADPTLRCERSSVPLDLMHLTVNEGRPAVTGRRQHDAASEVDAEALWAIVSDARRDFPVVCVGLDKRTGMPVVNPDAVHAALFPEIMVCVPADARAERRIASAFDLHLPGASPRSNAIRVYAPHPNLHSYADADPEAEDDARWVRGSSAELRRHPSLERGRIEAYRDFIASDGMEYDGTDAGTSDASSDAASETGTGMMRSSMRNVPQDPVVLVLRDLLRSYGVRAERTTTVDSIAAERARLDATREADGLRRRLVKSEEYANRLEERLRRRDEERDDVLEDLREDRARLADEHEALTARLRESETARERLTKERADLKRRVRQFETQQRNARAAAANKPRTAAGTTRGPASDPTGDAADADGLLEQLLALEEERDAWHTAREELRRRNDELTRRIEGLERRGGGLDALRGVRDLLEGDTPACLDSNSRATNTAYDERIVRLFAALYPDRMRVHENAWKSLKECVTRPSLVWRGMYLACTAAYEIYSGRDGHGQGNPGDRFREYPYVGGFELVENEGMQTHRDQSYMRRRTIEDHGRTLVVEPHLRVGTKEDESSLRLYFAWNPDDGGRIVVGAIGKHLENYITRTRKR